MTTENSTFIPKIKAITFGCIFILVLVIGSYVSIISSEFYCPNPDEIIVIEKGSTLRKVVNVLNKNGCIFNRRYFSTAMRITGKDHNIKFGRYTFKGINNIGELIRLITTDSSERVRVTIIEGWTIEQITLEIGNKLHIDKPKFSKLCRDFNFLHSIGVDGPSLEGFLFPDTYIMLKNYTEEDIIRVLVNQFNYNYDRYIKEKAKKIKFSKLEILTLASIIQGEAMVNDEMPVISSVYHNRLVKGMYLQADPTIQYIIPGKNRRLYSKDLEMESAYNTYKYRGLPPGAINNPGLVALKAAVEPEDTDYLFFVADGRGKHVFTKTNAEHNKAKQQYYRRRRGL